MTLTANQHGPHLDDAAFVRLRDNECDRAEESVLRTHLAACSECRENAEMINRLAEGFLAAVGELEHPKELHLPRRVTAGRKKQRLSTRVSQVWSKRRFVQIAAIIAVVVALGLTTAPARALVNSGWQVLMELLSLQPVQQTSNEPVEQVLSEPEHQTVAPHMSRAASFIPQGEVFLIVIAHPQAGGTLSVAVDTVSRATVLVFGNADSDELVVFRAGVRIHNQEVSSASYEFTLPGGLRSIEVQVAGRTVATLSAAELVGRAEWQLDLAGAGVR